MNSMDSGGVALALDWNGIPVPESLADRLSPSPPVRWTRAIDLGGESGPA